MPQGARRVAARQLHTPTRESANRTHAWSIARNLWRAAGAVFVTVRCRISHIGGYIASYSLEGVGHSLNHDKSSRFLPLSFYA